MPSRQIIDIPVEQIKAQILERDVTAKGIEELTQSIRKIGVIEPLIVAKTKEGFNLLAGKRRLKASQAAGLPTVPCVVLDLEQQDGFTITLHENMYRENLNAVDEALIYQQLRDKHRYSSKEIAKMIGQSEGYVSQRLQIILWPDNLTQALHHDQISFSVARELSMVTEIKHLNYLLKWTIEQGANYRTVRRWRIDWQSSKLQPTPDDQDQPPADKPPPTPPEQIPCYWCSSWTNPDKLVTIHLCTDCYGALQMSKDKL